MFRLSFTRPQEEVKTLQVAHAPYGLGPFEDINGNRYDCKGYGKDKYGWWAWLCPMSQMHPYYYDTSGSSYGWVHQSWDTYYLDIIKEES
jgi:hypothetical protein